MFFFGFLFAHLTRLKLTIKYHAYQIAASVLIGALAEF